MDQIEGQNKKDFNEVMKSKTNEKKTAEGDKKTAEGDKDTADENIAKASEDMVKEEALLKDDDLARPQAAKRFWGPTPSALERLEASSALINQTVV